MDKGKRKIEPVKKQQDWRMTGIVIKNEIYEDMLFITDDKTDVCLRKFCLEKSFIIVLI